MQRTDDQKPGHQRPAARFHLDDVSHHAGRTLRSDSESVKPFETARRFEAEPDHFSRNPSFNSIADGAVPAACANAEWAIESDLRPSSRPESVMLGPEGVEQLPNRMRWRGEAPLVYVRNAHMRTIISQPG